MKAFTVKNTWSTTPDHGWGNGYVAIPPTSSWHGVDYHQIPVSVHGGLTWSTKAKVIRERGVKMPSWVHDSFWIVGFDTVRESDRTMTEQDVERELYKLLGAMEQLDNFKYAKEIITQVRCPNCLSLNGVSHLVTDCGCEPELQMISCDDCGKPFYFSV